MNMYNKSPKKYRPIYFISFLAGVCVMCLSGCEKVIDVDLNDANPQIVIEGNLSFDDAALEVKVTKTGSYFGKEAAETVDDVYVFLENEAGKKVDAFPLGQGLYKIEFYPVRRNEEYTLHVETETKNYVAKSKIPAPVAIDSLSYSYQQEVKFFDGGYRILLYFSDPPDEKNYYRAKVYKNGELQNETSDIIVFDDSGLDGRVIQVTLRGQVFEHGDTARVEMFSIDENAWVYFSTFREMANTNPGSPAPSNPVSNFSNGALGYFSAWSVSEKQIIIGE
ncbi:protein of unknown function [Mariniphaga anaerophila]|uniref:DUF4249 domain-containing protein n=1 Tax=Mariniphaga anaerophila TaxID=1484053 RepID=A0A1M4SZ77_9BACT|nr:DUF4249 domain-containing protein [Mariniphaga anaerophila]SHE37485.1 protein of unknown function [Mariniphaga anaerophila]